jgi:hypothetical protein
MGCPVVARISPSCMHLHLGQFRALSSGLGKDSGATVVMNGQVNRFLSFFIPGM